MISIDRRYVDVHVIQTVPPSCINRDDTGSPKTAIYGGAVRARVSSQSWKRAMRTMFRDYFPQSRLGVRTLRLVEMVAGEISKISDMKDPESVAKVIIKNAGLKLKEDKLEALFFISNAQAKALAELAVNDPETIEPDAKKPVKERIIRVLNNNPGIDVALFGRMVASDPSMNTDASAQVAHSISTHRIFNEFDYYTAVDDLSPEDTAGAGFIGTVEFNSATLYRYATVAVHELRKYLQADTADAVREFVRAFVLSMPTGKQNTFANRTLPDAILVTIRDDQPVNLVGAFERPIATSQDGYVEASAKRLVEHANKCYEGYLHKPLVSLVTGDLLSEIAPSKHLDDLLEELTINVNQYLGD